MLGTLQAVYGGSKAHTFKTQNGDMLSYSMVNLLGVGEHEDEVLMCSAKKDVDLSQLVRFKEYIFTIDIVTQEKGKKVSITGIVPFEKPNK